VFRLVKTAAMAETPVD